MQFYDLFPVSVFHANLGRDITEKELSVAMQHSPEHMCDRRGSHRLSLERHVLDRHEEELFGIKEFIRQSTSVYIQEIMSPPPTVEFYITNSWFTFNEPGAEHRPHCHQNCILSGVFYFTGDGYNDAIDFINYSRFKQIWLPVQWENHRNEESRRMPANPGDLYIFPPDLYHAVPPTTSKSLRICMPYNVWIKGSIGEAYNINEAEVDWAMELPVYK